MRSLFPLLEKLIPSTTNKLAHKFFFYPLAYPYPEIEIEWLNRSQTEEFLFKDQKLKLYQWGNHRSEKKILLVHGWAGRATQYWKIIESLIERGYHVISYDAPGHGKSEGKTTNLPEIAEIIHLLHARFSFRNLCGHSLGGAACVFALKEEPQKIENLILISAPSNASFMLDDFLFKLNAGDTSKHYIRKMVKDTFGHPLEYYFGESFLPIDEFPKTLAFHDHDDQEVNFKNLQFLSDNISHFESMETDQLGHTKILRNEQVIEKISSFLG